MLSLEIMEEIERYLSYGWEWRVVCSFINYRHDLSLRTSELKQAYTQSKQA